MLLLLVEDGGRARCRLDHGPWVGVEEWVGRYAPCFRARGVQRIRCCNRIRKLACERASRWKTAPRSSAKLEQAAASSPINAVQILSNSWINRKPLCVLFYCDCKKFSSNCCRSGQRFILTTCECVCEAGGQLGKRGSVCLTGWTGAFTCVWTGTLRNPGSCHVESKARWSLLYRTHSTCDFTVDLLLSQASHPIEDVSLKYDFWKPEIFLMALCSAE